VGAWSPLDGGERGTETKKGSGKLREGFPICQPDRQASRGKGKTLARAISSATCRQGGPWNYRKTVYREKALADEMGFESEFSRGAAGEMHANEEA